MAASLAPLGDNNVGADLERLPGLVKVSCLDDEARSGLVHPLGKRGRVAHRQHYGSGPVAQDLLENGGLERPSDKADTPWFLGLAESELDLLLAPLETLRRPGRLFAAPADKSEAASVAYGGGQGPPAEPFMGASTMGCSTDRRSVNAVRKVMADYPPIHAG